MEHFIATLILTIVGTNTKRKKETHERSTKELNKMKTKDTY